MSITPRKVLVTGGYGVSGTGVVQAILENPRWIAVTAGRRAAPKTLLGGQAAPPHVSVDLLDAGATSVAFAPLSDITDVAFCAYLEGRTAPETVAPNGGICRLHRHARQFHRPS
jgi:hypothetical protein